MYSFICISIILLFVYQLLCLQEYIILFFNTGQDRQATSTQNVFLIPDKNYVPCKSMRSMLTPLSRAEVPA